MKRWIPDFCPATPACVVELGADWSAPRGFLRLCSYHQAMRDGGMRDAGIFAALVQTSRAKEVARYAVKIERGLDKEAVVPYRVEADGSIVIESGIDSRDLKALQDKIVVEVEKLDHPEGTSIVRVE